MGRPYSINITNGSGEANVLTGAYNVTADVKGYNNNSIDPSQLTVTSETNQYNLTISATGTLTIHISDGSGTNIVGATLIRCDSAGTTYGNAITTDENGNAVFNNVPFNADGTISIYFKQLTSDGEHEFSTDLQSKIMTLETDTYEIVNSAAVAKTFTLVDANYEGLPIATGTLTLS